MVGGRATPITISANSQPTHIIQCNIQRVDQCGCGGGLDMDSCNQLRCAKHTGLTKHALLPATTLIYSLNQMWTPED